MNLPGTRGERPSSASPQAASAQVDCTPPIRSAARRARMQTAARPSVSPPIPERANVVVPDRPQAQSDLRQRADRSGDDALGRIFR